MLCVLWSHGLLEEAEVVEAFYLALDQWRLVIEATQIVDCPTRGMLRELLSITSAQGL